MAKIPSGVGPRFPQVVVLFGATGDLARRKLLPGLFHLSSAGFIPGCRIIGVSLDGIDDIAVGGFLGSAAAPSTSSPAARCPVPTGKPSRPASTTCRWLRARR